MTDTVYTDFQAPAVNAAWLNDLNNFFYRGVGLANVTYSFGTLSYVDTNVLAAFASSVNSFNQIVVQNKSSGAVASASVVVANDQSTATTNYGDFGINSSAFTGVGSFSKPGAVYLAAATTDLVIGTYGPNAIHFVVNNGATDAGGISATGQWTIPYTASGAGAQPRTVQDKLREWISVLDFGADPTGAVDATAAFNLATQAAAAFTAALQYNIIIPSGKYLINGTVWVRAGQTLWGQGHGTQIVCTGTPAATPNFVLGSGSGGNDNSGSPVKIGNFWTIGGGATAGVIKSIQAGFTIADVFMTSPGIGIDCQGSDGLIYGVEIDQALTGMSIGGGNIEITNCNFYLANYAITLITGVHDVAISNCEFEYSQYAAILYPTGGTAIRGITLSGCNFTMNQQFATFLGFIVMQSSNSEVQATGCSFRNMYQWAINHNTGTGNQFLFSGCIFDGTPTATGYTSSTTAKVLNTVAAGLSTYDFEGCQYRNLLGEIATLTNGISNLTFNGGLVVNCPVTHFSMAALTDWPKITVKGVKGFAFIANTGAAQAIVLPYWGPSCVWKVSVKGNPLTGSSGFYAAAEEAAYAVTYQYNGTAQFTYVDKMPIWATPNRTIPGQLGAVVCFGTAPGGATSQAGIVQTGTICISVATTTAANFDWYAETAI